jgi:hypothetical protein
MLKFFRFPYLALVVVIPYIISSCSVFDPPTVVPAYGHIDSIHFAIPADSAVKEGTNSSNITAAWVYLDDNPVGAFQMPCTFPIIAGNGNHNIKIYSGIAAADAGSPLNINPFYQYYTVNVNLQQGVVTKFQPVSSYYDWVTFKFMENFDEYNAGTLATSIIDYHGGGNKGDASLTSMYVTNTPSLIFDGHGNSGIVTLNATDYQYTGMTDPPEVLPTTGTPVYLELNYRCTALCNIGLFEGDTNDQLSPSVIVFPTSTWKKLYVDLYTNGISSSHVYNDYRVYFNMNLDTQDGHTADTLLIDNIKIIY